MTVEVATYPPQLNTAWPLGADLISEGANHIRTTKTVLKTTFPNVSGAITASHTEINYSVGVTSGIQAQLNGKGSVAGQTWSGTHVFPSTTTVGPLTPTIQGYLSTVTSDAQAQINTKGAIAGQVWNGAHDFSSGSIVVPTRSAGDNSTNAASTAFVTSTAFSAALPAQAGNSGKFVTTNGTSASWSSVPFSAVTATPTTLAGYGITDAVNKSGDTINGAVQINGPSAAPAFSVAAPNTASPAIEMKDGAAAPNRWRVGVGSGSPTDGNFYIYDARQNAFRLVVYTTGNVLSTGGAIGYGTGAGGTVTQATSKTTGVTLNKPSGQITMNNAALAAGASAVFLLSNTYFEAIDSCYCQPVANASYRVETYVNGPGVVGVRVTNITASTLSEALAINFVIIKGVAS